jgi:hypothetical protein
MHYTFAVKLARIADAARGLRYAQQNYPGGAAGQYGPASACVVELDAAIKDLDDAEGVPGFDAKAYLEALMRKS